MGFIQLLLLGRSYIYMTPNAKGLTDCSGIFLFRSVDWRELHRILQERGIDRATLSFGRIDALIAT